MTSPSGVWELAVFQKAAMVETEPGSEKIRDALVLELSDVAGVGALEEAEVSKPIRVRAKKTVHKKRSAVLSRLGTCSKARWSR